MKSCERDSKRLSVKSSSTVVHKPPHLSLLVSELSQRMASNYYHDYQDYQNYSTYRDQPNENQNENGAEFHSISSPAPALTSPNSTSFFNRNVAFNKDNHNPIASADTTQTSYYQSQSTPSSFNSPPLVSSPTQSSNNNNPQSINTNLNRNIGTLASRETKTTEKTNGTGNSGKSTATAAVALNFWDSLVPSRWAGLYLGVILVEAVIVIIMVAIVFGMIEVSCRKKVESRVCICSIMRISSREVLISLSRDIFFNRCCKKVFLRRYFSLPIEAYNDLGMMRESDLRLGLELPLPLPFPFFLSFLD